MPWSHVCENGGTASVILNLDTANFMCWGKEPMRHIQHEAGYARNQFLCHRNKDIHLKIMLHYVILPQDILLTCHIQSTRADHLIPGLIFL